MDRSKINGFAVVTGASQGLGRAIAEECAGRGIDLILVALPDTGLAEAGELIRRSYGVRVESWETDLTEPAAVSVFVDWIEREDLPVGMIVNNAGTGYNGLFRESTLRENDATIELNILALVRLTHLLLPRLGAAGGGHILNVASLAAYFPMPYLPVYSPSKSFVVNFSLALREELRASGINVSVLCPNGIRTNPSCRAQIDAQGLAGRLTCLYPDEVARAAMRGLVRGKGVIVPGWINRALQIVGGLVPKSLVFRVVSRHWGTNAKNDGTGSIVRPVPLRAR